MIKTTKMLATPETFAPALVACTEMGSPGFTAAVSVVGAARQPVSIELR